MRKVGSGPATTGRKSIGSSGYTGKDGSSAGPFASDDLGLTFYDVPPDVEVSVREFEEYTRDRLRLLHVFDRLCSYESRLDGMIDLRPKVRKEQNAAHLLLDYPSGLDADSFPTRKAEFARRDAVSHFALRIAFCKTRESRDWFLKQEQRLFVMRYETLVRQAQEDVIAKSGLKCQKIDPKDIANFEEIRRATPAAKIFKGDGRPEFDSNFYTMPFYEVDPKMISARKVVIVGGSAYVPSVGLKQILAKRFKDNLNETLDVAFQGLPVALGDPRVGSFLRDLQEYGMHLLVAPKAVHEDVGEALTLENFDDMLARSMPPCMRRMVERQRESKKHLKHHGRLLLRPFLKECGLTFEHSLRWWKTELCLDQKIDATSFEKHYAYDVEHTYGKKGNMQGQNPFGCAKIIGSPPESAGQVHGCPFKSLDTPGLRQQMHKWKVPEKNVFEMEKLIAHGNHYQLACIEYFKATHEGSEGSVVGNNPGDFFRDSCVFWTKKREKEQAASPSKEAMTPGPAKSPANAA